MKKVSDRIKDFFEKLDCYLVGDLESMKNINCSNGCGGLNYPMIQTIVSGMELLGAILSADKKLVKDHVFYYFWDNYFIKNNIEYKKKEYGEIKRIIRIFIRHGTAHYFLVKQGISVTKEKMRNIPAISIYEDFDKKYLNIDTIAFYEEFRVTYENIKKDVLSGNNSNIEKLFNNGLKNIFKCLGSGKRIDSYIQKNYNKLPKIKKILTGSPASYCLDIK